MKKSVVVAGLGLVSSVFAAAPDGWQCVDGVYTPIQETVTTYPGMGANDSVYVGAGTNVVMSAAFALTDAKQGTSSRFVGSTLTVNGNVKAYVKGNDSKVMFDAATVNSDGSLTMNDNAKASGDVEVRFVNGTTASFKNGIWWQTQVQAVPVAAKLIVSNATLTASGNRVNIAPGAAKTDAGSVCDFAIEIQRDGKFTSAGFTASGNASSPVLKVFDGGSYETTGGLSMSTVSGVNAAVVCESGSSLVQSGGALIANAGARLQFDLVGPAAEDGPAIFSKLAGDYASFATGFLGRITVGKGASGTYKLMEVVGNPGNASRGVTGFDKFMDNVSSNIVGAATLTHWYVTDGSGAQTKYTWYAKVKKQGFAVIIR